MFLRDPYALHTISKTVLQTLNKMATEQKLPRVSVVFLSLLIIIITTDYVYLSFCILLCSLLFLRYSVGEQGFGESAAAVVYWCQVPDILGPEGILR